MASYLILSYIIMALYMLWGWCFGLYDAKHYFKLFVLAPVTFPVITLGKFLAW